MGGLPQQQQQQHRVRLSCDPAEGARTSECKVIANALLATTTRFVPVAAGVAVSVAVRALAGKLAFQAGRWRSTGQLGLGSWPTSNLPRPRRGQQGKTTGESRERWGSRRRRVLALLLAAAAAGGARAGLSNRLVSHKGPSGGRVTKKWPVSRVPTGSRGVRER